MKQSLIYTLGSLLLIFNASQLPAADNAGNFAIWGAGKKSCFTYLKTRKEEDDSYYRYYVMGYLTAYNTQAQDTYRISGDKDMSAILVWLDDFCAEKQVLGFDQALINFVLDHYPTRYKRPPTAAAR